MILYISGPMSGVPEYNYPLFHRVKKHLQSFKYEVLSPADHKLEDGLEWIDYILKDIPWVFQADGVAQLDGWETSKGARIECLIAELRNLPIKHYLEWQPL